LVQALPVALARQQFRLRVAQMQIVPELQKLLLQVHRLLTALYRLMV
jgi:hypothetical protein